MKSVTTCIQRLRTPRLSGARMIAAVSCPVSARMPSMPVTRVVSSRRRRGAALCDLRAAMALVAERTVMDSHLCQWWHQRQGTRERSGPGTWDKHAVSTSSVALGKSASVSSLAPVDAVFSLLLQLWQGGRKLRASCGLRVQPPVRCVHHRVFRPRGLTQEPRVIE